MAKSNTPNSAYFRNPKKARGQGCDAWWYANKRTIEIHADPAIGPHIKVVMTRAQLVEYLRRTK